MAADPRFFRQAGPQRLAAIMAAAGVAPEAPAPNPELAFTGVASLQAAGPTEVSFLENRRYLPVLKASRAGAVILLPNLAAQVPEGCLALPVAAPYLGFARVARLFHPPAQPSPGIHPTAVIGAGAVLGEGCEIGPYAVIGAGARLGAHCILGPHAVVGPGVELGEACQLHAHSSITHAVAGNRVVLHPGARVGQEGFGFAPTGDGGFETMPQLGIVRLGDAVEVGANSCIDRGSQGDTVIGPGSRLDNLVQIGHNVRTGRGCVIVGQAGIAGSTTLGDYVQIAAQAGLTGHIEVGTAARIGAQAGVINDVAAKTDVLGSPAWPIRETWRAIAKLRQLGARNEGKAG